jgi:hypothetical protein
MAQHAHFNHVAFLSLDSLRTAVANAIDVLLKATRIAVEHAEIENRHCHAGP